jgi:hypothetical protein
MRPIYEQPHNREAQRKLIALLQAERPELDCIETDRLEPYDFQFKRDGKVTAIVEVKVRQLSFHRFPNYMIAAKKSDGLRRLSHEMKCGAHLLVGFPDAAALFTFSDQVFPRAQAGRKDRNDKQDIESCEFIPLSLFRLLKK